MLPKLLLRRLPLRLPALAAMALALAACQDPSGVGLTLIGDETSDPNAALVATDSLFEAERPAATGGFANGSGTPAQTRILVGAFEDALLGDARATAYLDAREQSGSSAFDERAVDQVQIELVRAEVYGDTTASFPVEIREVTATWNPEGLPADTTLSTGDLLATETVMAQDSLVTLSLPSAYVQANQVTFRDSLDVFFEGFQIASPAGTTPGTVVAFNAAVSHLVLISEVYDDDGETTRDTVRYDLVEVYTAIDRGEASEVADRYLLRGGVPANLGLRFNLDAFVNTPLASARIRIPLAPEVLDTGDGFFRPMPETVQLLGVLESGARRLLVEVSVPDDATSLTLLDDDLTLDLQAALLGRLDISHFEIALGDSRLGLSALPVIVEEEETPTPGDLRRPRLSLITVGSPA